MNGFALYRFPHQKQYVTVKGRATIIHDYSQLGNDSCFVIAPFAISDDCPITAIIPEETEVAEVEETKEAGVTDDGKACETMSSSYRADFSLFHKRLCEGDFTKIVLARTADAQCSGNAERIFTHACNRYPRMFIALISSPQTGTWLTATPEILIEKTGSQWHTIALAGTMRVGNIEWSEKNIEEQRVVARYIRECISRHAETLNEEGPYAVRAGNLVHLRSDFTFSMREGCSLGELAADLHPTPAVCGLPKDATYRFIRNNESISRRYYSGFLGPVNIANETRLYVTLRCISIKGRNCTLYAGGGLLKESDAESEWQETAAKMDTMRIVIGERR